MRGEEHVIRTKQQKQPSPEESLVGPSFAFDGNIGEGVSRCGGLRTFFWLAQPLQFYSNLFYLRDFSLSLGMGRPQHLFRLGVCCNVSNQTNIYFRLGRTSFTNEERTVVSSNKLWNQMKFCQTPRQGLALTRGLAWGGGWPVESAATTLSLHQPEANKQETHIVQ